MEAETNSSRGLWDLPRRAQRRLFGALPLDRKLAIAADLADLVRAFQRARLSPWPPAGTGAREADAGETPEPAEATKGDSSPVTGRGSLGGRRLLATCLTACLTAAFTGPMWAAQDTQPTAPASTPKARVVKFVHIPEIWEEEGPRPQNVWVYGRFTARTAVSDGLFLASVNEGINWPDWEEHFNLIDNPGNYVFRRVVFHTKTPLPTIRKGTKFAIPKEHPARLVEIDRVDGVITRMVLESPPVIESQEGAGRLVVPKSDSDAKAAATARPKRVVPIGELPALAKQEGVHPENLWIWGVFSARSDLRDGIFTATPAGVESRRVVEWIAGAVLAYPVVEIPSRLIFYVHRPRQIRNGDRIVITPKHPARVKRLFLAGGVLAWLDFDPPPANEPALQLGSAATASPAAQPVPSSEHPAVEPPAIPAALTPPPAPSPERIATGSP
ncbi:hypothetical protein MAMC_01449 [Methylacidimicrobium cyclopophantes]|uniref:Uncharacterized protein n=1 Tax=Methylacidimicrobium cyclopophantes TaxID=1041766 RepID=A0A5E6MCH4_9BACT|nr:hypothetical protein [Methylacidimicrobium cyclopophantes]VVM07147.1 hypothetical protein MAMC_01449 [Methylacidimicrobium cyclopophantes]